jgi:uncharacterized Zn finger protein
MTQISKTWWGRKFIEALEEEGDSGRLSRGRSYARPGNPKIKHFEIQQDLVIAQIRGSVNPYFGVYKEPTYTITIEFEPISPARWTAAIALMATKASLVSRLMLNEMPDTIDDTFSVLGLNLLPRSSQDFQADCTCPDWGHPCKHIAGTYYLIAAALDRDPFLLFELRGLSRQDLLTELAKTPLGSALATELQRSTRPPQHSDSYYTRPIATTVQHSPSLRDYWHGERRLPDDIPPATVPPVAGIPIKKQGDRPPFWERDNSFIEAMETIYNQVRKKGGL